MTEFVFVIELIGTIAFAVSGVIVAIQKSMDVFGVIVLGVTTAVGGGMIRDIILGILPPTLFLDSIYVFVAVTTSILVFLVMFFLHGKSKNLVKKVDPWINAFDSIGLGTFVVSGVNTASNQGLSELAFLSIFVGALTGIGGGILRDIFAGRIPVVLHKRIYAVAAISGAFIYYYANLWIGTDLAMLAGIISTLLIRMFATYFKWDLPRIQEE